MRRLFIFLFLLFSGPALAQQPLSSLAPGSSVSGTDLFYDVQTPGTGGVKVTGTQIQTFVFGSGTRIIVAVRSSGAATVTASATSDYFLCLDPTSNAITLNLPGSPATGLTFLVKDCTGQAGTHNITVTPAAGNIDGNATFVMNINYQSAAITYTGSQWSLN